MADDWIGQEVNRLLKEEGLNRRERRGCLTVFLATLLTAVAWWAFVGWNQQAEPQVHDGTSSCRTELVWVCE